MGKSLLNALRHLGYNNVTALPRLTNLSLSGVDLDERDCQNLHRNSNLSQVRTFDLSENAIGCGGAAALAVCPMLTALTSLNVGDCGIGAAGGLALARTGQLRQLEHLDASNNQLGTFVVGRGRTVVNQMIAAFTSADHPLSSSGRLVLKETGLNEREQRRLRDHFGPRVLL